MLIDNRDTRLEEAGYPGATRVLCDHHFGIGSDGLIILENSGKASVRMIFYNPDGTRDVCGNGMRCVALYLQDHPPAGGPSAGITIEMDSGMAECEISGSGIRTSFDYPRIVEAQKKVEINGRTFDTAFINAGTPHCVTFIRDIAGFPLSVIGPLVEKSPMFPETVNFDIAEVRSRSSAEVRIWERSVGETLACGTGAAAVVAAGQHLDIFDESVSVSMPGGTLTAHREGDRLVQMGSADYVFEGSVDLRQIMQECPA